jgi:hypothetical protein
MKTCAVPASEVGGTLGRRYSALSQPKRAGRRWQELSPKNRPDQKARALHCPWSTQPCATSATMTAGHGAVREKGRVIPHPLRL